MKICPQCQSTYTDDTLKFCLQDGGILNEVSDDKTLVLNQDSISDDKTIVDNVANTSPNDAQKTEAFSNQQTYQYKASDSPKTPDNLSVETISRERKKSPVTLDTVQTKKSGLGFLTGLIIGILLLGLVGAGILGAVYLPSIIRNDTNSNTSVTNTNVNKTKTLTDTDSVKVTASSTRKSDKGNFYSPKLAFDGNSRTAWCEGAKGAGKGQWIVFDFKKEVNLKEIIIEPGYFKTEELWRKNNRLASVIITFSDKKERRFDFKDVMKEQKIVLDNVKTESVMIAIKDIYAGQADSKDTLLSEVKFVINEQ